MAASATRSSTTVSGGNSRSATPLKKNDPPHSTESSPSRDQSRASIRLSLAVIAAHVCATGQTPSRKTAWTATRFPQPRSRARARTIRDRFELGFYGLRKQRPTVGDVPHFAPSGAPPLGQNTDTRVSLASQLAAPSASTDLRLTAAAWPLSPGAPLSPLSPLSPFSPGAPFSPGPP